MSPHNYTYQLFFDPKAQAFVSKNGGDDGIRTHDPLLAGQVLSQLSYTPIYRHLLAYFPLCFAISRRSDNSQLPRPCSPYEKSAAHLLCKSLTLQCSPDEKSAAPLLCKSSTLQCLLLPHGFLASEFTCFIEL